MRITNVYHSGTEEARRNEAIHAIKVFKEASEDLQAASRVLYLASRF